jgi:dolichol kinase
MQVFLDDIIWDFPLVLVLFSTIAVTVFLTRKGGNVWVNRKLIHLSSSPAAISYMYVLGEPYLFFLFAIMFAFFLSFSHLRSKEFSWFQMKNNFGEVFYCVSFAALSIGFWSFNRILAGVIMLFMSIGDSVTGIIRSRIVKERKKHWAGSVGMLVACLIIGFWFLGVNGAILAVIATLAEYQPWIDDNLSVALVSSLAGLVLV